SKMGHAMSTVHGALTSIISRQRETEIAVVPFEQRPQVLHPALQVLLRVERIPYAETHCRPRNQLHQPQSALGGDCEGVPIGFGRDHCADQRRVNPVLLGRLLDHLIESFLSGTLEPSGVPHGARLGCSPPLPVCPVCPPASTLCRWSGKQGNGRIVIDEHVFAVLIHIRCNLPVSRRCGQREKNQQYARQGRNSRTDQPVGKAERSYFLFVIQDTLKGRKSVLSRTRHWR